jgi:hypothetical protein
MHTQLHIPERNRRGRAMEGSDGSRFTGEDTQGVYSPGVAGRAAVCDEDSARPPVDLPLTKH